MEKGGGRVGDGEQSKVKKVTPKEEGSDGVSGDARKRGRGIKRAREDKMFKSDVREEGRGRDLLEERLSQVVPGQSLIRFKSN